MTEKQKIAALTQQVVILTRTATAQRDQINSLSHAAALMADAMAQYLDGRMSQRDAAANLHGLNAQASQVFRLAS